MAADLYYLAYGSNLDPERLARHLGRPAGRPRWTTTDHGVQFAGRSRRWEGGVAFLTVAPAGVDTPVRAYPMDGPAFAGLFASENFVGSLPDDPGLLGLAVGDWVRMLIPGGVGDWRGKYDAIVRLADLDGVPAYTLTTCRELTPRAPGGDYLGLINRMRAQAPYPIGAGWQGDLPRVPDLAGRRRDCWYGTLQPVSGTGVSLPADLAFDGAPGTARVVDPSTARQWECPLRFEGPRASIGRADAETGSGPLLVMIER